MNQSVERQWQAWRKEAGLANNGQGRVELHNVRLRFCPIIRDGSAEDQFGPGFKSESDNCANTDKKDNNNNLSIIKNN